MADHQHAPVAIMQVDGVERRTKAQDDVGPALAARRPVIEFAEHFAVGGFFGIFVADAERGQAVEHAELALAKAFVDHRFGSCRQARRRRRSPARSGGREDRASDRSTSGRSILGKRRRTNGRRARACSKPRSERARRRRERRLRFPARQPVGRRRGQCCPGFVRDGRATDDPASSGASALLSVRQSPDGGDGFRTQKGQASARSGSDDSAKSASARSTGRSRMARLLVRLVSTVRRRILALDPARRASRQGRGLARKVVPAHRAVVGEVPDAALLVEQQVERRMDEVRHIGRRDDRSTACTERLAARATARSP